MEFGVRETKTNLDIEWNGPTDNLCRKLVLSSVSQRNHLKIYLFYPIMPANHVLCLMNRLRQNWFNLVGRSTSGANKAHNAIANHAKDKSLIIEDDILIKILEEIHLDDVASDIDLVAIKNWKTSRRSFSLWAFCFAPDDLDHFLKNAKVNGDVICYGKNGDNDLV